MTARVFDFAIRNGTVVMPGGRVEEIDIAVESGRITGFFRRGLPVDARETIDAAGLLVMPGAIDVHLHLGHGKDISRPRKPSDAASETGAAASGGVTAFVPYLLGTEPYEGGLFEEVKTITQTGARIDFGYHFIISTEAQLAEVARYATEFGAPSFKIFMNNRGGEGERLGLPDIDDGFFYRLADAAAACGGMVCPHPESIEVAWVLRERVKQDDPNGLGGLSTWNRTRPPFVEADAVQRAAILCKAADAPLYIVHTSSADALEAAMAYRRAGGLIHIETCPHYLTHDVDWERGEIGKINPPLREAADRDALWKAIIDGGIDTIASDHVHREISSKEGGIWNASPGCPGTETLLPVMLSEGHHKRGVPLGRIADLLSRNPARIMGLGKKGGIEIGKDADFALIDLNAEYTLDESSIHSDAGYSIYEDWKLKGKIVSTLVRGKTVYSHGSLIDDAIGIGRYIHRVL